MCVGLKVAVYFSDSFMDSYPGPSNPIIWIMAVPWISFSIVELSQPAFTCSKLAVETLEQGVKYVLKLIIKTPERRQASVSI